jgi:hypothetical protein
MDAVSAYKASDTLAQQPRQGECKMHTYVLAIL